MTTQITQREKQLKLEDRKEGKNNWLSLIGEDLDIRGAYDKFPDFFRMATFIDSTHMKL